MRLLQVAAIVAAFAVATSAIAQQATTPAPATKADCEKAKMRWDDKGGKDGKGACMAAAPATKPGDMKK